MKINENNGVSKISENPHLIFLYFIQFVHYFVDFVREDGKQIVHYVFGRKWVTSEIPFCNDDSEKKTSNLTISFRIIMT